MNNTYQKLCTALNGEFPGIKFLDAESAQVTYGNNSLGYSRIILGAIYPRSHEEITRIVILANSFKISLYPVSTGHNWGYGSATPVLDHCVIINLSLMNTIDYFDNENGLITLGPGVTLHQLWNFLKEHNYPWIVPVTGAGYLGSLLGNALERGFGIPPFSDHCSAVMSLKAVIADGSTYESLHETLAPNTLLGKLYKWGLGAYCDGLFSQSNFGIVTEVTLALRKQPQEIGFCLLGLNDSNLNQAIAFIKYLNQQFSGNLGYIQMVNKERYLSLNSLADEATVQDWSIIIVLYGQKKIVKYIHKDIKEKCKLFSSKNIFFNETKLKQLLKLPSFILRAIEKVTHISINDLKEIFAYYRGKPTNIGIENLIYPDRVEDMRDVALDIEEDRRGILWFAPLIPQAHKDLTHFITCVEPIFKKHGIKLSICLTAFHGYCFDGTIPLLFDRTNMKQKEKMQECYNELLDVCIKNEFIPYRLGIQSMGVLAENSPHYDLVEKIKNAIDPNNILAPGRYHFVEK